MSTSASPAPYHHGNLRAALVAEALQALGTGDENGLGLRELARRVGVSSAAPYRHFADRRALLEAVSAEGFRRLRASCESAAMHLPLDAQLEAMARGYVGFALGHPRLFRLMFSAEPGERRSPELVQAAEAAYAILAVTAAREDTSAPGETAVGAWALVHGLAMLLIDRQIPGVDGFGADALVTRLARRFVAGLRAPRQ